MRFKFKVLNVLVLCIEEHLWNVTATSWRFFIVIRSFTPDANKEFSDRYLQMCKLLRPVYILAPSFMVGMCESCLHIINCWDAGCAVGTVKKKSAI